MVDFKVLQFRDSKSALGVVAANIPSTSVDHERESFRISSCRRPVFYPHRRSAEGLFVLPSVHCVVSGPWMLAGRVSVFSSSDRSTWKR